MTSGWTQVQQQGQGQVSGVYSIFRGSYIMLPKLHVSAFHPFCYVESLTGTATTSFNHKKSHYFSTLKNVSIKSNFQSKFRLKMDSSFFWCQLEKTNQPNTFSPLNVFFFSAALVGNWWRFCSDLLRSSLTALHTPRGPFAYRFVGPMRCSDEPGVPLGEEYAEPSVK